MFSRYVQGHVKKFGSFGGKKTKRPKKSLTLFMQVHLQFVPAPDGGLWPRNYKTGERVSTVLSKVVELLRH